MGCQESAWQAASYLKAVAKYNLRYECKVSEEILLLEDFETGMSEVERDAGRLLQKAAWEKAPAPTAGRQRHATQANEAGDCREETHEQQPGAMPPWGFEV